MSPQISASRLLISPASTIVRPPNTTVYDANDAVASSSTAATVVPFTFTLTDLADTPAALSRIRLSSTDTGPGTATASFEVYLFNQVPVAGAADNAAWAQSLAGRIGKMSGLFEAASDGSYATMTPDDGVLYMLARPALGTKNFYGLMKTLTIFTPSANSTSFTATLEAVAGRG
jgi:hypothetical protein